MGRSFFIILIWVISIAFAILWGYENPEKVESIKGYFKKNKVPEASIDKSEIKEIIANSFNVEFSKVISLSEKTAFVISDKNFSKFNESSIKIYTQNGYVIEDLKSKKLNLPKTFTLQRNGGVKTIFFHENNAYALISSEDKKCFYASIVSLKNSKELLKSQCLPDDKKNTDFNGLGSSFVHLNNKIYLSLGTPEQYSSKIAALAQDENSMFGKILEINLDQLNSNEISAQIFTKGHRTPQGLTKIKDSIFSVEHGPKGGDELNKLIENKNYGWPLVSYGTKYLYDNEGKSFVVNHEDNNFEEPLFALVPSVGISSLNTCPKVLANYYKKPCLIALSLKGNNLRSGKSLIIYLLSKKLDAVHSIEKIQLSGELRLRHFVTSSKNELYEDERGDIFVSVDKNGIYRISFSKFR